MYRNFLRTVYMNQAGDDGGAGGAGDPNAGDPNAGGGEQGKFIDSVPDDWREQLADGDESKLNQLKRLTDFKTFANNYFEAQQKIRSGEITPLKPPTAESSDEEVAAYRELMGVPEKADDYELTLDEGLVLSDDDNLVMSSVYEAAHSANIPPQAVSILANAMLKGREVEMQKMQGEQTRHREEATTVMREAWMGDYDTNINLIRNTILGALPEEMQDEFEHAMMPNGRKIFNSPEVMTLFADIARKVNPAATVVPSGSNPAQTIETEIAALEARMGTPEWYKDTAAQKRYQDLIDAKASMQ